MAIKEGFKSKYHMQITQAQIYLVYLASQDFLYHWTFAHCSHSLAWQVRWPVWCLPSQ